jgi:hypothetical protein
LSLMKNMRHLQEVYERPNDFPGDDEGQAIWLKCLAAELVDLVWRQPPKEDFDIVREGYKGDVKAPNDVYPFCTCKQSK